MQIYAIFGSFGVNLEIHESRPLDSNLEPTNPPLKDSNLTNPMASLLVLVDYTNNQDKRDLPKLLGHNGSTFF